MRLRSVLVGLLLTIAVSAYAASPSFLSKTTIDPAKLLPPPPLPKSGENKAELELLIRLQGERTAAEVARVQSEANLTVAAFQSVLGPWFTSEKLPYTMELFRKIGHDAVFYSNVGKDQFNRKRPRFEDSRIQPVLSGLNGPSYPSGHATLGMLYSVVLAELAPEQREAFFERGREIGWDRVIGGVHYPSDVIAGRVLGLAIARAILADPAFRREFAQAKTEFDAVRGQCARGYNGSSVDRQPGVPSPQSAELLHAKE